MINLTDDLYLGSGNHKMVYAHPTDKNLCIKILHKTPDEDMQREFRYRKALGSRADSLTLLTKYFGEVETSRGKGYVFERVIDFDGKQSKNILWLCEETIRNRGLLPRLESILLNFKRVYFEEKILLAGIDESNYFVQRISSTETRIRIIDNIGTSAFIPLAYYFDFFTVKRAKKYWRMFVEEVGSRYRILFSEDFLRRLGAL